MNEVEKIYADMSSLQREIEEFLTEENDMSEIEAWHKIEGAMLEIRCLAEETLNGHAENTPQSLSGAVMNATKSLKTKMKAKKPTSEKKEKRIRKRCAFCGRAKDRKVSTSCSKCNVPCCRDHILAEHNDAMQMHQTQIEENPINDIASLEF
ncbi:hypothetical protein T4B_10839 [Trichinella pseudospiralis]|uniref:Uncharacterized protein n=2 Tax=Trichinella pseudospiralis TaxID=6337 RepID=A0A0V1JFT4_TRIPS|nr:hypothetical protein T4B_10839 [Trichinella pseudospiralis]KRZ37619.1 hypothetical protein T4C_6666 [Trichinella pseudospiralis]